jgi:hypothetical protein
MVVSVHHPVPLRPGTAQYGHELLRGGCSSLRHTSSF